MFFGPALHGRFGSDKFAFTTSAGIGGLTWMIINQKSDDGETPPNEIYMSVGGFVSAGINIIEQRNTYTVFSNLAVNIRRAAGRTTVPPAT
jgi:hypothetical protein